MNSMSVLRFGIFAGVAAIVGCGGSDAPKTPLGATPPAAASAGSSPGLTGEAKIAIDSGNALFRLKAYDQALAQYNRSAELAPNEMAPLLGILMVADITRDSKLANETLPRIRKLDPSMADSSAVSSHSKVIRAHPRGVTPPST